LPLLAATAARAEPETVYFKSADGTTEIVGYLYKPDGPGPHPAIVLLHGRAGPYSSLHNKTCTFVGRGVTSDCNAGTLSMRHQMWGKFWASKGMLALLPDSFGPRGVGKGFPRFSHGDPEREATNEKTVRPFDAEGALTYLRARSDVAGEPVFLQGWSNGGSTMLNVMIRQADKPGFRAALAFYPAAARTRCWTTRRSSPRRRSRCSWAMPTRRSLPPTAGGSQRARSTPAPRLPTPSTPAPPMISTTPATRQDVPGNPPAKKDATDKSPP
jgi:carboxymethylenebutenolidase